MRTPLIAGNWKMNNTISESIDLTKKLVDYTAEFNNNIEVLICAPFTALYKLKEIVKNSNIHLGAQNVYFEEKGAFTGEISPIMLQDIGVEYVIIGHSERRQYFLETDEIVNKKLKTSIKNGLKPILCVGETLEQRESGKEKDIIKSQIIKDLKNISELEVENIVVAYEPIWAIGTGKTATSEQANEMITFIRKTIEDLYNEDLAKNVRIQYGGSVKPKNTVEIMSQSNIDGALVGGASLKVEDFQQIISLTLELQKS